MEMKFKVAMDKEQAELKNHHEVIIEVSKCDDETMLKYAKKAYIVELQSQIRANWTAFIAGSYPKSLVIGQAMFESTRGKVTQEKAQSVYRDSMASLSQVEKLKRLLDDGMIDVDMYEASVEKLHAKGELTDDELDQALDI